MEQVDSVSLDLFPLLLPSAAGDGLEGFITCDGRDFGVRVVLDSSSGKRRKVNVAATRLEYSPELQALLRSFEGAVAKKVAHSHDVGELLMELRDFVERLLKVGGKRKAAGESNTVGAPGVAYFERLVHELDSLGASGALVGVNERLDEVTVQARDVSGRIHRMTVSLTVDYPTTPPVCFCDLPIALVPSNWDPRVSTLQTVLDDLVQATLRYQSLWEAFDDIDNNTWVLEPENPSRSTCTRRIAVAPHCSVHIQVDPLEPFRVPKLRFLGAEKAVQPLVDSFNSRAKEWNAQGNLRVNLQRVLGIEFPSAATSKKEDYQDDHCGICYEYRVGETIPSVICGNAKCNKAFHRSCLYDWLRAIPTTKHSFSSVFGQCPFCEAPIVVQ
jgi:E3 ubiquitin-protein ligase FANCL